MQLERSYEFTERKQFSEGIERDALVTEIIVAKIPGAVAVKRAGSFDDKRGTDYWVTLISDHQISVDVKFRQEDFSVRSGIEDLALETLSVIERNKIGWTLDPAKRTDYVLWIWLDTRRWTLLPFLMLCATFQEYELAWRKRYRSERQFTPDGGYHSECVFVPTKVIYGAMFHRCCGTVARPIHSRLTEDEKLAILLNPEIPDWEALERCWFNK
jgi:hypothetical protein